MGFTSQMKSPLALSTWNIGAGLSCLNGRHPFPLGTSLGIPPTSLEMHGSPVHPEPYLSTLADVLGMVQHISEGMEHLH